MVFGVVLCSLGGCVNDGGIEGVEDRYFFGGYFFGKGDDGFVVFDSVN